MSDTTHPEWLAVGSRVEVVRMFGFGRSIVSRYTATVVRHTKTTVVLDDGARFKRARYSPDEYVLTPPYLDYRTYLRPSEAPGAGENGGGDE